MCVLLLPYWCKAILDRAQMHKTDLLLKIIGIVFMPFLVLWLQFTLNLLFVHRRLIKMYLNLGFKDSIGYIDDILRRKGF